MLNYFRPHLAKNHQFLRDLPSRTHISYTFVGVVHEIAILINSVPVQAAISILNLVIISNASVTISITYV